MLQEIGSRILAWRMPVATNSTALLEWVRRCLVSARARGLQWELIGRTFGADFIRSQRRRRFLVPPEA